MIFQDLREFLDRLESEEELHRIDVEVDPRLEIAAITDRVSKRPDGGRALLFKRVRGCAWPVATNLFGSLRRARLAMGDEAGRAVEQRVKRGLAAVAGDDLGQRLRALLSGWETRSVEPARAPCLEIEEEPDLGLLPALRSWPGDGGPFLTQPLVFTRDPDGREVNCGIYRMQVFDAGHAGLHLSPGSDGGRHLAAWRQRGEPMPVAVALGGDPALICAAGLPLPPSVREADFAGYLRGEPIATVACRRSDLHVPAGAEFVLEGVVEPAAERDEGPFGNHTGYYTPPVPCPVLRLTGLSRRRHPLYPATVAGPPPMETAYMAKAAERLVLCLLRSDFPEIVDINLPLETIFHGCALLSIRKEGGEHPRRLIEALWQSSLLRGARFLAVFDAGADIQNLSASWWRAANNLDPVRDLLISADRIGIDATDRPGREKVASTVAVDELVRRRWREYGLS